MIYRSDQEQNDIYKGTIRNGRSYDQNPWKSPHQFWQAADIRSTIFTDNETKDIENYLNSKYNNTNYYRWTAKCHKIGEGAYHFHIQYYKN